MPCASSQSRVALALRAPSRLAELTTTSEVGQAEHAAHRVVQQAGAAVGEDQVVEALERVDGVAVVLLAAGAGDAPGSASDASTSSRVGDCEVKARTSRVAVTPVARLEQVADRRAGLAWHPLDQRAAVGVGVDGDHPVAAQVGEHRAERGGRRRLADAALEADDREPVAADDGRPGAARPGRRGGGRRGTGRS